MKYHYLIIILACSLLYACPPRTTQQGEVKREADKTVQADKKEECSTPVLVRDFTGMDGCRFLR